MPSYTKKSDALNSTIRLHGIYYQESVVDLNGAYNFCVQLPVGYTIIGGMSTAKSGMQVSKVSWQRTSETVKSVEDAL